MDRKQWHFLKWYFIIKFFWYQPGVNRDIYCSGIDQIKYIVSGAISIRSIMFELYIYRWHRLNTFIFIMGLTQVGCALLLLYQLQCSLCCLAPSPPPPTSPPSPPPSTSPPPPPPPPALLLQVPWLRSRVLLSSALPTPAPVHLWLFLRTGRWVQGGGRLLRRPDQLSQWWSQTQQ